ncbi:MAG: hypothetical protein F6J95_033030 [Leptolyngbya sp. SIO1E4]|nr:hypothetical protein [Leptolyngbya sp. SIO1E4]
MSDALWQFSEIASPLADHQVACGVVRHPVTQNWQTWFSLYGTDITCIFSSKSYGLAHAVRQMFITELRAGGLVNRDRARDFMTSIQTITGSELMDPLPQRTLECLGRQIRKQLSLDDPSTSS